MRTRACWEEERVRSWKESDVQLLSYIGLCLPMSTIAMRSASLPSVRSVASTLCHTRAYARAVYENESSGVNGLDVYIYVQLGRTLPTAWDIFDSGLVAQ